MDGWEAIGKYQHTFIMRKSRDQRLGKPLILYSFIFFIPGEAELRNLRAEIKENNWDLDTTIPWSVTG